MNATMRGQLALSVCANISFRVSFILIVKDQVVFRGVVIGPAASSGPVFCVQVFTWKVDGPIHQTALPMVQEKRPCRSNHKQIFKRPNRSFHSLDARMRSTGPITRHPNSD